MKTNKKSLAKVLVDMSSGDQPKDFLVVDGDAKKDDVVVLSEKVCWEVCPGRIFQDGSNG